MQFDQEAKLDWLVEFLDHIERLAPQSISAPISKTSSHQDRGPSSQSGARWCLVAHLVGRWLKRPLCAKFKTDSIQPCSEYDWQMLGKDIPPYGFLTLQFLVEMEKQKASSPYSGVHQAWLQHMDTQPRLDDFNYCNPAALLMAVYVLLVFPVEFWKLDGSDNHLTELGFPKGQHLEGLFQRKVGKPGLFKLLKGLRNSVSHARITFNQVNGTLSFSDVKPGSKTSHFEVEASYLDFLAFLSCVGSFFANHVRTMA